MGNNSLSGMGAVRDEALRAAGPGGRREQVRIFNYGVAQERTLLQLGEGVQHADIRKGNFCSVRQGRVVSFDPSLGFGGVIQAISQEPNKGYMVSVIVRAAMQVRLTDLSKDTPLRSKVYALAGPQSEMCTLAATGVPFAELLAVENMEQRLSIVGFKPSDDARPFEFSGNRRGGLVQSKT